MILVFGAAAAFIAGVLVALVTELLAPRVRSVGDLEWSLGAPVFCDMAA